MKAIFIDAANRSVREVELPNPKEVGYSAYNREIYKLLGEGTERMELAVRLPNNDVIFVDEEGIFNPKSGGFSFNGSHTFMGNGIVCGGTNEGASASVKAIIEDIRAKIRFAIMVPRDI